MAGGISFHLNMQIRIKKNEKQKKKKQFCNVEDVDEEVQKNEQSVVV